MKSFFKETTMRKKCLYNKYTAFSIIRTNATKRDKYFMWLPQIHNYLISLPTKPER